MRRDITPPPSKRPIAHRQHDVYRPSSYAQVEDFGRGGRLGISDVWRPGPNHYSDVTNPGPTSARSPEQIRGERARRAWQESSPRQTYEREPELSPPPPPPSFPPPPPPPPHDGFEKHVDQSVSQASGNTLTAAEVARALFVQFLQPGEAKNQGHNDRLDTGARQLNDMGESIVASIFAPRPLRANIDVNSPSVSPALPKPSGTGSHDSLATREDDLAVGDAQSSDFVVTQQGVPLEDTALPLPDPKLFLTDAALSSYLQSDTTMNSPNKTMVGGTFKWARFPAEDTASNPSTTNSKNKLLCRECRTPGSVLTPLVPCTLCSRGYHHSCGNPKPPKGYSCIHRYQRVLRTRLTYSSAAANEFVCGKCLKSQKRDPPSREPSRSTSFNDSSVHASATLKTTFMPQAAGPQAPPPPPHTNTQDHSAIQMESSQGTLYKSITCPWWSNGRCYLFEDHCLFAHIDTGQSAPTGRSPARAFTCPAWRAGHCHKASLECLYSHRDTGLHVTFSHQVVRKHITCYYWKVYGTCRHYEEDCPFAHRDTGILAWKPAKDSHSAIRTNSLKNYICPRFERQESCRYPGECPYAHNISAISCLPSTTVNQLNTRRSDVSPVLESLPQAVESFPTSLSRMMSLSPVDRMSEPENTQKADEASKDSSVTQMKSPIPVATEVDIPNPGSTVTDHAVPLVADHPRGGRQMAKRGGRTNRFMLKPRTNSSENTVPEPPAQTPSDMNPIGLVGDVPEISSMAKSQESFEKAQKETGTSSHLAVDTDVRSTTENRVKKCNNCGKMILGVASQCRACTTIDVKPSYDHLLRAPRSVSDDSDVEITGMATLVAVNSQEKSGKEPESEESSRQLVANVLKRTNRDDHLFIQAKKHKPSYAADLLAEAESRLRAAALTNPPLVQSELHLLLQRDSSPSLPLAPLMENVVTSVPRVSSSPQIIHDSSTDDPGHPYGIRAPNQSSTPEMGASLSRLEEIVRDVTSQVKERDAQKRASQIMPTPVLGSPILGTRDGLQGSQTTKDPVELDLRPVQPNKQSHLVRNGRGENDDNTMEDQMTGSLDQPDPAATDISSSTPGLAGQADTTEKAKTTSTALKSVCQPCRIAHKKCVHKPRDQVVAAPSRTEPSITTAPLDTSDQVHQVEIAEKAEATFARTKFRCKPCIDAHKKCLHKMGGTRDELDPQKCVVFLQSNPTRPQNGKISLELWQQINIAAQSIGQNADDLGASNHGKDATEANIAVSETESSNESMTVDAELPATLIQPGKAVPKLRLIVKDPPRNSVGKERTSTQLLNIIDEPLAASDHLTTGEPARTPGGDRPEPWLQTRAAAALNEEQRQLEEDSDDDLPLAFTRSRLQDDSDDDLPLALTRSSDRVERYRPILQPRSSTSISQTPSLGLADARNKINVLKRPRDQSEDFSPVLPLPLSGSVSSLSTSADSRPVVVIPKAVSSKMSGARPRHQPQPQPSEERPTWTEEDEQRALDTLRARGVVIESESEDDGDASDYYDEFKPRAPPPLITDPLHHVTVSQNPFDVDHSLDIRNVENRYRALDITPPWKRNRPSKKQLMGGKNLLLYQTRENKLKYGDPHKQLIRKVGDEVPVTALVETDDFNFSFNFDTPRDREPSVQRVQTTFREFMGMPKQPVIVQGKNKDELVFLEKKLEGGDGDGAVARARARRVRDDEIFPFIYN